MALLKAFVSSTCYDLNIVRNQLRSYIQQLGHEPVMSDHNDILFDPRLHTHESCVKEIGNADVVILIIGSRFGGTAIPKAITSLDIDNLKGLSSGNKIFDTPEKLSITQLEILKAVESNIPIFTFIDSKVLHDHLFYEKNKDKGILDNLEFPSIENKKSAIFIFEFINFIRLRSKNNSIVEFSRLSDIEDYLKRQWSALFQRLLFEQKLSKSETKRLEAFSEELKDIKSLILSSISTDQAKEVGKGVLRFRRLIEFLHLIRHPDIDQILSQNISWENLLNIVEIDKVVLNSNSFRNRTYLLKKDGTFYEARLSNYGLEKIIRDWDKFRQLSVVAKQGVISAIAENFDGIGPIGRLLMYKTTPFDEFITKQHTEKIGTSTSFPTQQSLPISEEEEEEEEEEEV